MSLAEAQAVAASLATELSNFDSRSLVAAILLREDEKGRNPRRCGGRDGLIALAEYAPLLRHTATSNPGGRVPTLAELDSITERLAHIVDLTQRHYLHVPAIGATHGESPVSAEYFQARIRSAGISIRNPGDPSDWITLLHGFSTQNQTLRLRQVVGFELPEALDFVDRYNTRTMETAHAAIVDARKNYTAKRQTLRESRKKRPHDQGLPRGRDVKRTYTAEAWDETFACFRQAVLVSPSAWATELGLPQESISTMIAAFSTRLEELDDKHLVLPSPLNPLIRTPIIADELGYYCPNPSLLYWALLPRIADLLSHAKDQTTEAARAFHRYERAIARFVEETVNSILMNVGVSQCASQASYDIVEERGIEQRRAEVDAIGLIDRTLVIAECKAAFFSAPALRGGEKSLFAEVKRYILDAQAQADRAANAAMYSPFQERDGTTTNYSGEFDDVIKLLVVLDNTSAITSSISTFGHLELLGMNPGVPITLLDLIYASRRLTTIWAWKHYFLQRARAIKEKSLSIAHDEEDFLALYVLAGRTASPPSGHLIHLSSPEVFIDDTGDIYKLLNIDGTSRRLISALETSQLRHWTAAVGAIIELRGTYTRDLANAVVNLRPHSRAILQQETDGFTFVIVPFRGITWDEIPLMTSFNLGPGIPGTPRLVVYWNLDADRVMVHLN